MARKAKKGSSRYYFTMDTEKAIIRYNEAEDKPKLRNKIYNEHIRKAFEKLVENIIHTFKFYYFDVSSEEVKHEVVSFLVMNMHKFKEGKGRAFSYFSIVAKNYLILNNNKNYKMGKIHSEMDVLDYKRNTQSEKASAQSSENATLFVDELQRFWDVNLTNVFKREMTGSNTQHITRIINVMKKFNERLFYEFDKYGTVDISYTGSLVRQQDSASV